jgi:hypothetical protein
MFFRMLAYRRDARSNQPARKVRQTLIIRESIVAHAITLNHCTAKHGLGALLVRFT